VIKGRDAMLEAEIHQALYGWNMALQRGIQKAPGAID
jgi:hypothetical protein